MAVFNFDTELITIKRVDNITGSTFNELYKNKKPVILSGILKDWLPMQTWTEEYIKDVLFEEFGDQLTVLKSNDNTHFINHFEVSEKVEISLTDFMNAVFHPEQDTKLVKYYLRTHSMPSNLYKDLTKQNHVEGLLKSIHHVQNNNIIFSNDNNPPKKTSPIESQDFYPWEEFLDFEEDCVKQLPKEELHTYMYAPAQRSANTDVPADIPIPYHEMFCKVFKPETMQLWVGTSGNITPLHFDRNHGLLAQFIGCKELILFSHTDTHFLYPYPSHTSRSHTSRVNLRDLDKCLEQFPRLKHAQRYTCVLNPGEILYTPPFWWHDVTSLDGCLSVTLPWDISIDEVPLNMLM